MSGCARILAALAMFAALTSCGERGPAEPDSQKAPPELAPPDLAISDPTGGPNSSAVLSATDESVAYVSASPGSFPDGVSVTITNLANGSSVNASIQDGGFDPVALPAESGDELEIVVRFTDGATIAYRTTVPPRRRPRVVRTRPPKGDTDVVLNATVVVVVSEPLDKSTVTKATIQLRLDGAPVEGTLTLSEDGLRAEFVPAEPLLHGSQYTLVVTQEVLDLDGDPLEEEVRVTFTTVSPPTSIPSQIAFTYNADGKGNFDIYVMNADGTGRVNLTQSQGRDDYPVWSPDGSKIAFLSNRDGDREVYVMNASGKGGQVNLTNSPFYDWDPAWSPNGSKIAFDSHRSASDRGWIYVVNSNGTGLVNLTNPTNGKGDHHPVWSPDGRKIAFISQRHGPREVYVMNADGSGQANLSNSPFEDSYPTWSPDGSKIAFASHRDDNWEIYVMNADGTGQVNLTNSPGKDWEPAWSPDGSKITFRSDRDGNGEIYVMNADGTGQVNLTNSAVNEFDPVWSPDGSQIAFQIVEGWHIHVMNADGSGRIDLGVGLEPAWRPPRTPLP